MADKGSAGGATTAIGANAYSTIVLHACKHPARPILGMLLGKTGSAVSEAVPLFHSYPLAPMLEMGMTLAEEHAKAAGLEVVGCYFANELCDDKSFNRSHMAVKLATKIAETAPSGVEPCLLMVDNTRVSNEAKGCLETYRWRGGNWRSTPLEAVAPSPDLAASVAKAVREGKETASVDFEEHLDNPALNWLGASKA